MQYVNIYLFGVMMFICLFVDGPTTASTGVANCVMRYDGTNPQCGLKCNAPYVSPAIQVVLSILIFFAGLVSFLTLPKTIVFKFNSEWSLLRVTVWEFKELIRMKEVVESLGVNTNNCAQQCYDFCYPKFLSTLPSLRRIHGKN
jgi:hypothetical protein